MTQSEDPPLAYEYLSGTHWPTAGSDYKHPPSFVFANSVATKGTIPLLGGNLKGATTLEHHLEALFPELAELEPRTAYSASDDVVSSWLQGTMQNNDSNYLIHSNENIIDHSMESNLIQGESELSVQDQDDTNCSQLDLIVANLEDFDNSYSLKAESEEPEAKLLPSGYLDLLGLLHEVSPQSIELSETVTEFSDKNWALQPNSDYEGKRANPRETTQPIHLSVQANPVFLDIKKQQDPDRTIKPRPKGSKGDWRSLDYSIDYSSTSVVTNIVPTKIQNIARNVLPSAVEAKIKLQLVDGATTTSSEIVRTRYTRPYLNDDFKTQGLLEDTTIRYDYNPSFLLEKPYEPEYFRYFVSNVDKLPLNYTRHGLCPYCEELRFFHMKTSGYGQHLALFHGIFPSYQITPDPICGGVFEIKKINELNVQRKRIAHKHARSGVVCPACFEIVETECTKTTRTERPLTKYLRHFRDCHVKKQGPQSKYCEFRK